MQHDGPKQHDEAEPPDPRCEDLDLDTFLDEETGELISICEWCGSAGPPCPCRLLEA